MIRTTLSVLLSAAIVATAAAAPAGVAAPTGAATTATAPAKQSGRIVRATDLRDLPSAAAKLLEVVPANTDVTVLERQGGWYRVSSASREGWVRLTAVRFATATPSSGGGLTASLGFLKSGRSAVQSGTVTTGVRGLSETDLANSVPDPDAVDRLDALAVAPEDAQQHARALGLSAVEVPFIKAPKEGDKPAKKDGKGKKQKDEDDEEGGG
jgi:hypothetical protein